MKITRPVGENQFQLRDEHSQQAVWDIVGMAIAAVIMLCMILSGFMPVVQ